MNIGKALLWTLLFILYLNIESVLRGLIIYLPSSIPLNTYVYISSLLYFVIKLLFLFLVVYLLKKYKILSLSPESNKVNYVFTLVAVMGGIAIVYIQAPIRYLFSFLPNFPEYIPLNSQAELKIFELSGLPVILVMTVLVPIMEELFYRGFILKKLLTKYNSTLALFISALLFGIMHFNWLNLSYSGLTLVFITFLGGLMAGILYIKTNKVIYPIMFHTTWNMIVVIGWYVHIPL